VTILPSGAVKKVQSWSLVGGIEHYWAPTISTALFGSYGDYNPNGTDNDVRAYGVGANVKWTPVKGLLVAGEGVYQKDSDFKPFAANVTARQSDIWHARLRVQRDF
jgi:Porin subfamily